jgi:hypothetical protein
MKVYTVYLNGDQGWTGNTPEGFYNEVINTNDYEIYIGKLPTQKDFDTEIEKLTIGESYKVIVGDDELEVECVDMDEEEFNSLGEFTGW